MHAEQTRTKRASDYIRRIPARNLHHGIRLAESIGLPLNLFVSINFALTSCPEDRVSLDFQRVRAAFGKWVTRPHKKDAIHKAPPTYVWVIENQAGCLNAHWLVHVPRARQKEFRQLLTKWLENATGEIYDTRAIDIKLARKVKGVGRYMLKGMHPAMARNFAIEHEYQGWVTGRRIGHSKNIGPVQLQHMRRLGKHPPARRWIHGKYKGAVRTPD